MTLVPPSFRPPSKALGYKPDKPDPRDVPVERAIGAPGETIVPASMMQFRVGFLAQGNASSCVAFSLTRALDMSLRHLAVKGSSAAPELPKASPGFIYYNARRQEMVEAIQAGQTFSTTVHDGGCYPRLAMRSVQKTGYCRESDYPYGVALHLINEAPPPAAFSAAYDQRNLIYYRIGNTGVAKVAAVAKALAQGFPVIFGMFVDSAYLDWDGVRAIDKINAADPNGGGHMQTVLEVTPSTVVVDNWWGDNWGRGGLSVMTHACFAKEAGDVYAVQACPVFSNEKPQ